MVHELGHFLVARWCGVKVLRFSVGFGKPLWTRRAGADRTEWVIAAFPLGGYVKMLDEREGAVAQRGAAARVQPAIGLAALRDRGRRAGGELPAGDRPLLGIVRARRSRREAGGRRAAGGDGRRARGLRRAGRAGQGRRTRRSRTWQDARWVLLKHAVQTRRRRRSRCATARGERAVRQLDFSGLTAADLDGDFLRALGLARFQPELPPEIGRVVAGGAAERAGLKAGDEIVSINDTPVKSIEHAIGLDPGESGEDAGHRRPARRRATRRRSPLVPDAHQEKEGAVVGRINAVLQVKQEALRGVSSTRQSYGWLESVGKALYRTWDMSVFSLRMLGKMIVGEVSLKNLSGPITIADYAGQSAQSGWVSYLMFLALISISLGVLNLLPIPVIGWRAFDVLYGRDFQGQSGVGPGHRDRPACRHGAAVHVDGLCAL